MNQSGLACNFCGRDHSEVRLVAGPAVYICDECVKLCQGILDEGLVDDDPRVFQPQEFDAMEVWRSAEPAMREGVMLGLLERADAVRKRGTYATRENLGAFARDSFNFMSVFDAAVLILADAVKDLSDE